MNPTTHLESALAGMSHAEQQSTLAAVARILAATTGESERFCRAVDRSVASTLHMRPGIARVLAGQGAGQ